MEIKTGLEDAFEKMEDLVQDDPESAWLVIQEINSHEISEEVMACLAAGPLEDLLAKHGRLFIERIEIKAKTDKKFSHLLGGVWQSSMELDIWDRVKKARSAIW